MITRIPILPKLIIFGSYPRFAPTDSHLLHIRTERFLRCSICGLDSLSLIPVRALSLLRYFGLVFDIHGACLSKLSTGILFEEPGCCQMSLRKTYDHLIRAAKVRIFLPFGNFLVEISSLLFIIPPFSVVPLYLHRFIVSTSFVDWCIRKFASDVSYLSPSLRYTSVQTWYRSASPLV